jgi:hypothetical protein
MGILDEIDLNVKEGANADLEELEAFMKQNDVTIEKTQLEDLFSILTKTIDDWNRDLKHKKEDIKKVLIQGIENDIIGIRD